MVNLNAHPAIAIAKAKTKLYNSGLLVKQEHTHSRKSPDDTIELLNYILSCGVPHDLEEIVDQVRPNLPWADNHFEERVSGIPHNPPPSADEWPFNPKSSEHRTTDKYSHTYPERIWPKRANGGDKTLTHTFDREGIRYTLGDLEDLITLLEKDNSSRQAFLPIWFPEDTGAGLDHRVPCTLGYHFIIRRGFIHVNYYMRSCDIIRHLRDDIYMAMRLLLYIQERLGKVLPGVFNMYITSLHCYAKEKERILKV